MRTLLSIVIVVFALAGCSSEPSGPNIPPVPDSGATSDAAKQAFGANCTDNAQCESNVCFKGGSRAFCSMRCTAASAATDCPNPPTAGTCNNQGYCKAPE
jgi:hypothetical protein